MTVVAEAFANLVGPAVLKVSLFSMLFEQIKAMETHKNFQKMVGTQPSQVVLPPQ
jgi:hypothetical protein